MPGFRDHVCILNPQFKKRDIISTISTISLKLDEIVEIVEIVENVEIVEIVESVIRLNTQNFQNLTKIKLLGWKPSQNPAPGHKGIENRYFPDFAVGGRPGPAKWQCFI